MHNEVLNQNQSDLLKLLGPAFNNTFYLAGGTALALQLGHRESIDLDFFSSNPFDNSSIVKTLLSLGIKQTQVKTIIDQKDEYTALIDNTKITFLYYPFNITNLFIPSESQITIANELAIGAMKAYALGRRSKWKDYVDLFMLLHKYTIKDIIEMADQIFGSLFSEKLFREQLCYFQDIDFTEEVIWKNNLHQSREAIEVFLIEKATKDTLQK